MHAAPVAQLAPQIGANPCAGTSPGSTCGGDAGLGGTLGDLVASGFDHTMRGLWDASLDLLNAAFSLADSFSVFSVSTATGPLHLLWPLMVWIASALALGLFFWQLIVTVLRGGRGFWRLIAGPAQYGVALAVTVGLVAGLLAAADGVTAGILHYGLSASSFTDALHHTTFGQAVDTGIKAVVLGICAAVGVVPAAVGYVLEMLFREAAVDVLTASVPIVAAGLLAGVTARWFWTTCRWLVAAIAMKPVLALVLVMGVAIAGGSTGLNGLLTGVGILVISLLAPFAVFRLLAFVDPASDAGSAFRDTLRGVGVDSYGTRNPAVLAGSALNSAAGDAGPEATHTGRFDTATEPLEPGGHDLTAPGTSDVATGGADRTGTSPQATVPDHSAGQVGEPAADPATHGPGAAPSGSTPPTVASDDEAGAPPSAEPPAGTHPPESSGGTEPNDSAPGASGGDDGTAGAGPDPAAMS